VAPLSLRWQSECRYHALGRHGVLTADGERVEGVSEEERGRHNYGYMSIHSSAARCQAKKEPSAAVQRDRASGGGSEVRRRMLCGCRATIQSTPVDLKEPQTGAC